MNYTNIYHDFIADRKKKEKELKGYSEKHHILPRSLGGGDDDENLVKLSLRDHVFAHALLAKIHGGPMFYAYWMMVSGCVSYRAKKNGDLVRVPSHFVAIAKRKRRELISATRSGENHHFYGVKRSKTVREKISTTLRNKYDNGFVSPTKNKVFTAEHRMALSVAHKKNLENGRIPSRLGKTHTQEARAKISAAQTGDRNNNYGKPLRKEHAEKIGRAQIGIKNHAADKRILRFTNKEHGEFTGYRSEFIRMYSLSKSSIGRLVKGSQRQHKGWFFEGVVK